jgi:hypothetical protein
MELTASGPGVAARKRSEVRQRTEVVALRLLPGERVQLETAAKDLQVSLSELIRSSALEAARTRGPEARNLLTDMIAVSRDPVASTALNWSGPARRSDSLRQPGC